MSRLNLSDFLNQRRLDRNIERVATGHERAPMAAEDLFDVITAPRGWSQSTPDALTSAGINPDDLLAVSGAWDPSTTAGSWFEQFGGLEETQRDVQQRLERPAERWFAPRIDAPELAERAGQAQQRMAADASEEDDGRTTWDDIRDRYEDGDLGVGDPQAQAPGIETMLGGMVGSETQGTADQRDGFWSNALDRWTGHVEGSPVFDPVSGLLGDRAGDATRRVARGLRDRTENLASGDGFVPTQLPQMERLLLEIEDGTFTPESEEELNSIIERGEASERELAALQRAVDRAEVRGMETDRGDGLLIRAIEGIQRGQSSLVGLTSGLAGEEGLDEQDEVAESGLESNLEVGLSRFLRGITGDRVDRPSNYTPWDQSEWDWEGTRQVGAVPVNARLARGTAHTADFIADVIGDPATYLTFGAGGLTRKATSELATRAVVPTARQVGRGQLTSLSPQGKRTLVENAGLDPAFVDTVTTWANRGNVQLGRQGDRVVASAVPEGQTARNTTNTVAEALWREADGVAQLDRWGAYQALEPIIGNQFTQELLERGLAQMAGAVRHGHGATGLRRQLANVFGDDTVFDALPRSVRGGVQLTVPFVTKRTDFGTDMRWSFELTKGGGRNPLARASADWYNKVRREVAGSPTGQWWQGLFGGRAAAGLQDMSQALLRGDESIAGRAWSHYQAVQDNFIESGARRRRLADQAKNTAQAADVHLRQATDYDQARDALRTVFAARGSRTLDPKTGQLINPDGSLSGRVVEGVTPLSSLPADAVEAAEGAMQTFALHMDDLIQGIRRLGDVGYLGPDYTPRVFADQMDDMLRAGGSRFTISRSGNYATHRISGSGNVETSSWLSAVEVRQEAARRGDTGVAFVDNPLEAMTDYIDAASRLTDRMHTLDGFRRAGLVIDVTPTDVRAYTDAGSRELLREAASSMDGAGNAVRRLKEAIHSGDEAAMRRAFGPLAERLDEGRAQGILDAASSVSVRQGSGATPWQALDVDGRVLETFETEKAAQLFANRTNHIRGSNRLTSEIELELFADKSTLNRLLDYRNIPVDDEQAFRQHIESISNRVGQWLNDADPDRVRNVLTQPSSAPTRYREMIAAQPGWAEMPDTAKDAAAARMLSESGAFSTDAVIQTLARYNKPPGEFAQWYAKMIQPAYMLFKNYATIGSGPRFAVRNAVGGHWQSWVQGVNPKYMLRGFQMMRIEEQSKRAVLAAARKSKETVNRQQLGERVQAEVRRRMTSKWGEAEGARLADALGLFYERNLMTGSRTDDLFAPVLDGRSVTGGDVLGGEFTSRMRGGPQAGGLGETGLSQARGWRRLLQSEGQYADQMDPALRRLAGMESTVFAGRGRTDLLEGAAEGATRRERAAAAMRRGAQEAQDNPYIRMGASMAEMSEKWTRIAPFLKGLDDYGIEDGGRAAGLLVKAGQFDYGDLTEFERKVMRQIFPFYTFTRNNVPFQLRSLAHSPEKIAKLGHAHNQMEEATGDDAWHETLYPRWVRDNMGVATEWRPSDAPDWVKDIPLAGALFQSQDPIAWNLSSLPAMDLNKLLGPSGLDELIGMANPLFKTALEFATDIDSFTRGELPSEERVEWAADWARHLPGFSRDDSGDINVSTYLSRPLRNAIPPVGMAERLLGSTERYDNRKLTSWASTLFGLPVSTLDEFQVTNHVRRETQRISRRLSRQLGDDITPSDLDRLVEAGIPSDVIVGAAEDGELPQLFELLDIYEAGQEGEDG